MVSKLWGDVREGRVLVVHEDEIPGNSPLFPTPTTIVATKLLDQTMSLDVRIISDLRLSHMFCDQADYPVIHPSDISDLAIRSITIKGTWPNVKVICCKRGINASANRVRTHHDMCALLRAEFSGRFFDMAGNFYFLYLTLPFGRRGSHACFPSVGRVISSAHKNVTPPNKLWGGFQEMCSFLFTDDAIFVDRLLGRRPGEVVARWEGVCQKFLGPGSLYAGKLIEEGGGKIHIRRSDTR